MLPGELLEHWRLQADDMGDLNGDGSLWTTDEVVLWVDDAQRMFCRFTEGIEDLLTLDIAVDEQWYVKDPRILKTSAARFYATDRPGRGDEVKVLDGPSYLRECGAFDARPGRLHYLIDGVRKGFFRASYIPNEVGTVELQVNRLPSSIVDTSEFEIDEQHHLALLDWIFKRAYSKHDADTFDPQKAQRFEQTFRDYCEQAKREQTRARVQPTPVAYGGY